MHITVKNPNSSVDPSDMHLIKKGITYYLRARLTKSQTNKLRINIFIADIEGGPYEAIGLCIKSETLKDHFTLVVSPSFNIHHQMQILAHECIHLTQYVTGSLDSDSENYYWKGDYFGKKSVLHQSKNYNSVPWEDEAFKLQSTLYNSFADWLELQ